MTRWRRTLTATAACTVLGLGAAGCGHDATRGETVTKDPTTSTGSSVAMEGVITDLETMRGEIVGALNTAFGEQPWGPIPGAHLSSAGCKDGEDPDGSIAILPTWGVTGSIGDDRWPQAVQIVGDIATKHGFTSIGPTVDKPGEHEIQGDAPDGARFAYGQAANTTLSISTGCHVWRTKSSATP